MAFTDDLTKLSEQVKKRLEHIKGEEATKQSLILPFFAVLGYDIYDPTEVKPEFISDAATKKAGQFEKVDYAILLNGTVSMLVEAKAASERVVSHDGQLKRYFTWTKTARVGIVTNGMEYRFFTDLRASNIMDEEPFLSFNILDYTPKDIEDLKFFHRDNFDPNVISHYAEEIVYTKVTTKLIGDLLRNPSEEFIRFLVKTASLTDAVVNSKVIDKFKPIIKKSIQNSLVDLMKRSLEIAIDPEPEIIETIPETPEASTDEPSKIVTTEEELDAFSKIQTICASILPENLQIKYKDTSTYFSIHLGNPNWWFIRLYLSSKKKSLIARIPVNEAKQIIDIDVQDCSSVVGSPATRIYLQSTDDLRSLETLIQKVCYAEALKHP